MVSHFLSCLEPGTSQTRASHLVDIPWLVLRCGFNRYGVLPDMGPIPSLSDFARYNRSRLPTWYNSHLSLREYEQCTDFHKGCTFLISVWYTRYEVGKRLAAFWMLSIMANGFAGILAYGLTKMNGIQGIAGWRCARNSRRTVPRQTWLILCYRDYDYRRHH